MRFQSAASRENDLNGTFLRRWSIIHDSGAFKDAILVVLEAIQARD